MWPIRFTLYAFGEKYGIRPFFYGKRVSAGAKLYFYQSLSLTCKYYTEHELILLKEYFVISMFVP